MAELDSSGGGAKGKKVRSKKQSTRVDLTAMVDLAFLLITFFMLTTSLSKPLAMDVAKPVKDEENNETQDVPASRTMTVLLGKDGKVAWYMGKAGDTQPTIEGLFQVRKAFIENKKKAELANGNDPDKPFIVIVKPTSAAKYQDFVNIMDELNIVKVLTVSIDDVNILDSEVAMMKTGKIL
ncbi:MAG: biopolymer transporter ExbD [Pedobacter sp.]|nr:MAG: biopolymer transporter ExbD [Pedobacter sp.]